MGLRRRKHHHHSHHQNNQHDHYSLPSARSISKSNISKPRLLSGVFTMTYEDMKNKFNGYGNRNIGTRATNQAMNSLGRDKNRHNRHSNRQETIHELNSTQERMVERPISTTTPVLD